MSRSRLTEGLLPLSRGKVLAKSQGQGPVKARKKESRLVATNPGKEPEGPFSHHPQLDNVPGMEAALTLELSPQPGLALTTK